MERGGLVGRSQHRGKLIGTRRMIACLRAVEDVVDEIGDLANLLERHLHIAKPLWKLELRDEASHAHKLYKIILQQIQKPGKK